MMAQAKIKSHFFVTHLTYGVSTVRYLFTILLCCSSALAQTEQQTAYKAQHGWALPRQIATTSITQGMVIDVPQKQMIVAETAGLERFDLNGQNKTLLLEQPGIRDLRGVGTGQSLALAWYQRDAVNPSGVWWWYKGKAKLVFETPYTDFALLEYQNKPLIIAVVQQGTKTVVVLQHWGLEAQTVFQTDLNIGALAANALKNQIGIVFAEGYRNSQDEKYDLRFLTFSNLEVQKKQSAILAPAVYVGREQRYGVLIKNNSLVPIWWYETPAQQRLAAFTKQHQPRWALWENSQVVEFAPPSTYIGQIGNGIYYAFENQIFRYDLNQQQTRTELITPQGFRFTALSNQRIIAWQSLQADGFTSQVWRADSSVPFKPNLVDEISRVLGWNPWFPVQNLFGQVALALIIAGFMVGLIAPFVWILRGRFEIGQGTTFGIAFAWLFLVLGRIVTGSAQSADWLFAPLLNPSWIVVLIAMGLGGIGVFLFRKQLNGLELGATIAASAVLLIGLFIPIFSRLGFMQF
jgi:hypothetical protein